MNYEEIMKFAQEIDLQKVDSSKRVVVKCYRDMIIEQVGEIFKMEKRIDHFKGKITEHLIGLEKLDIIFKVKETNDKSLCQGNEKSIQMQGLVRESGVSGRDGQVQQVVKEQGLLGSLGPDMRIVGADTLCSSEDKSKAE